MAYGKIKADAFIYDDGGDQEITTATIASNSNKAPTASPTFTGTVTLPATTALAGQASDVTIIDNNAAALEVKEGANTYVTFDTTNSAEQIEVAKPVVASDNIILNAQNELRLADSDSSNYIAFASPATVSTNSTWTLPSDAPAANDVLTVSSVSSNNPTLAWAPAAGGKVVNATFYENRTKQALSASTSGSFIEWFNFSVDKQESGTDLIVLGFTQMQAVASGGAMFSVQYGTGPTEDQCAGAFTYGGSWAMLCNWNGRINGHTTTGSQTMRIGHRNYDSGKPAQRIHPDSTENGGWSSTGSGTHLIILEIDFT